MLLIRYCLTMNRLVFSCQFILHYKSINDTKQAINTHTHTEAPPINTEPLPIKGHSLSIQVRCMRN